MEISNHTVEITPGQSNVIQMQDNTISQKINVAYRQAELLEKIFSDLEISSSDCWTQPDSQQTK